MKLKILIEKLQSVVQNVKDFENAEVQLVFEPYTDPIDIKNITFQLEAERVLINSTASIKPNFQTAIVHKDQS